MPIQFYADPVGNIPNAITGAYWLFIDDNTLEPALKDSAGNVTYFREQTLLNGTVNPTTEGVDGDFYINTSTWYVFGPKAAGVWPAGNAMTTVVSDGDKGDLTITGGVWTLDNGVVTPPKLGNGTIENSALVIDGGLI